MAVLSKRFVLLLISLIPASAQPPMSDEGSASPRIAALRQAVESGDRAAVTQFWEQIRKLGTPLVEAVTSDAHRSFVTFLWRAETETRNVVIVGGPGSSISQQTYRNPSYDLVNNQLKRLLDTDVWFKTYTIRSDARFTYRLSPNDSLESLDNDSAFIKHSAAFRTDPLNPKRFGPDSVVGLPEAPSQKWITRAGEIPKGKVEQKKFRTPDGERPAWIYTPPGYDPAGGPYPLLVIFDSAYLMLIPAPVILDNLIDKKLIPPMLAIVLDYSQPQRRMVDLTCSDAFNDQLVKEIVPWMRENYHATTDARRTIVAGSSLGGLAAAYAGLRHPEVFGNVMSQSGSFWWSTVKDGEPESLAREFAGLPTAPVRFFLEAGQLEWAGTPGGGPSQLVASRHMRDILNAKGYTVHYQEFVGGHSYLNWRGSFADGLLFLAQHDE